MECENKSCYLYDKCHIRNVAQNCSIYRGYLKSEVFSETLNKSIDDYTKPIEEVYPEISIQVRSHARRLIAAKMNKEDI